jgi:fumarate reductase flavoprotein subunit
VQEPDLLVVGGGVAGLVAARRAQQLGCSVVVFEKHHEGPGLGNGRFSGGWFHASKQTPDTDPDVLFETIMAKTDGAARPDVARAWADNVNRAFTFLRAEGGDFQPLDAEDPERRNALMPQRPAVIGQHWQGTGVDLLLTAMWRRFVDGGGTFLPAHPARRLVVEDGAVVGVVAESAAGEAQWRGAHVLLADGGFQGNAELVARYITAGYKLRGSPNDTGDALQMGLAAGAVAVNMDAFYGWPLCEDALRDERLWPYPGPPALISGGVLVDDHGRRFVDEGLNGERVALAIAKSDTPQRCWAVCDATVWEGAARLGDVPINPSPAEAGGTVLLGQSIDDVAVAAGLPADALSRSVAEATGAVPGAVARTGPVPSLVAAPFVAVPVVAGITFAMGGLLVDGHGRVLDAADTPIPGLHAAGGAMGGLQGGPRAGYSGGWSEASTFGLLVAEDVARAVGKAP